MICDEAWKSPSGYEHETGGSEDPRQDEIVYAHIPSAGRKKSGSFVSGVCTCRWRHIRRVCVKWTGDRRCPGEHSFVEIIAWRLQIPDLWPWKPRLKLISILERLPFRFLPSNFQSTIAALTYPRFQGVPGLSTNIEGIDSLGQKST